LVDVTIPGIATPIANEARVRTLKRLGRGDTVFKTVTKASAIGVLIILGGIFASLIFGAAPAFQKFGLNFFITEEWNPVTDQYGALAPIAGTLVTSFLALLIALPVGLGIAIFLTELCPRVLRRPIGIAIELLAGVPSIIYGIWGAFIFGPFLRDNVQPALISVFGNIPILSVLFAGPPLNYGVLTASLILAIMVLPFITAVSRDVFETVPVLLKESAYGIGCTVWEVIRSVIIPYTRIGLLGGAMLALGRALGETMAVTFVIGNADRLKASLLAAGTTISAKIANEFAEADPGLQSSALVALGLILFIITFIVLAFARLLLMRLENSAGSR
jgi:phosphate transport system permease protein